MNCLRASAAAFEAGAAGFARNRGIVSQLLGAADNVGADGCYDPLGNAVEKLMAGGRN
jgi:hypothetical protein